MAGTMYIPSNFVNLLNERIRFCQAQIQMLKQIPDSATKLQCLSFFETGLSNFATLRKMSAVANSTANPNTKVRFKDAAKAMVAELMASSYDQMQGVTLIEVHHNSLNLLEGLEKIYKEIEAI
jgi:hypothetical protein